jgi:hypothetical protein
LPDVQNDANIVGMLETVACAELAGGYAVSRPVCPPTDSPGKTADSQGQGKNTTVRHFSDREYYENGIFGKSKVCATPVTYEDFDTAPATGRSQRQLP